MDVTVRSLQGLAVAISDAIQSIIKSSEVEEVEDYQCYWTNYGLLLTRKKHPVYFFHNNQSVFCFREKDEQFNYSIGMVDLTMFGNSEWQASFFEMAHGVLMRSIMDDNCVPHSARIALIAEQFLAQINGYKEEHVKWIIS